MLFKSILLVTSLIAAVGCGSSSGSHADGGGSGGGGGGGNDGGGDGDGGSTFLDAGYISGTPITCPGPGHPKPDTSSCGSERWNIKTGTDSQATGLSLVPQPNMIATLVALPAAGGGTHRTAPTETTLWELSNVTLTELKVESDGDYHLVISDGHHTMIAEVPSTKCSSTSAWACFISDSRARIDAKYTVSTSPQYPSATISLRGIGFFDFSHSQNGVAPNAIELHPVLQICFGANCTPD